MKTVKTFEQDSQTLGRLQGLIEAWEAIDLQELSASQEARIYELYETLSTRFVVHVFNNGHKSDQIFLSKIEDVLTALEMFDPADD